MSDTSLSLAIVGAGGNTRQRHIPGFLAEPDVQLVGIANRTRASAEAVVTELGQGKVYDHWQQAVQDPAVQAVCIGTWPDSHAAIACAALDAGKHVLCEARLAATLAEGQAMLASARRRPDLVAQVVPAPFTLAIDAQVVEALPRIGQLRSVQVVQITPPDDGGQRIWRHRQSTSGCNVLGLGIHYESLLRWLPPARRVAAMTRLHQPWRGPDRAPVDIADEVTVLAELLDGTPLSIRLGNGGAPTEQNGFWMYGSHGYLHAWHNRLVIADGSGKTEVVAPETDGWRVEAEFIDAIRTGAPITNTTFHRGVQYLAFTEAVQRAGASGDWECVR